MTISSKTIKQFVTPPARKVFLGKRPTPNPHHGGGVARIIPYFYVMGTATILAFSGGTTDFLVLFATKIRLKPCSAKALRIHSLRIYPTYLKYLGVLLPKAVFIPRLLPVNQPA